MYIYISPINHSETNLANELGHHPVTTPPCLAMDTRKSTWTVTVRKKCYHLATISNVQSVT